jgi:hypothetical protein
MLMFALGARLAAAIFQVPDNVILPYTPMIAPIPRSMKEILRRAAVNGILVSFWNVNQGFHTDQESGKPKEQQDQPSPSTYGEITTTGARQLFEHMGLTRSLHGSTFMDLGSGTGKLVTHACLELDCLERAVGIELDASRHAIGMDILKRSRRHEQVDYEKIESVVHLYCGDMFDLDVLEATHLYIASLCFTKEMMHALSTKLQKEAPKLQCVATLQPFPPAASEDSTSSTFALIQTEYIEMSWTKPFGCPVYFYRLENADEQ